MEEINSDLYIGFSVIDMAQWLNQINILTPFIYQKYNIYICAHIFLPLTHGKFKNI